MTRPLDIVIVGLALSSSWGNGHATTFRALIGGLAAEGHRVLFLERDVPWYASHRDLPEPGFCEFALYDDIPGLLRGHGPRLRSADAVIVGSYVPEGAAVIDALARLSPRMLCFYDIDTPVTMGLLDEGEHQYLAPRQVPGFDIYFSFSGGEVLRHLEEVRGAQRAEALYCSVDPALYAPPPVPTPPKWDMGYLGTYSPDRQPGLEALLLEPARRLPRMHFVVAGSRFPEDIDWPPNVERIEHLPPADHAAFYGQQRFTLNLTRAAMRSMGWSPSVRLFEAGACGTPVISDRWQGLGEVLPEGEAVLIADRTEDAIAALTTLPEPARLAIAAHARRAVLGHHTGRARARELAAALRDHAAQTRAPLAATGP